MSQKGRLNPNAKVIKKTMIITCLIMFFFAFVINLSVFLQFQFMAFAILVTHVFSPVQFASDIYLDTFGFHFSI